MRVADVLQRLAVQGTVQPGGQNPVQHWAAGVALVVSGGLGMPDVHGRPAAKDVTAAANCDHAQVSVVTASDVHFSRGQTIEVLEQVLPSSPSGRHRSSVSSRRGWQMQASRLDGEAQSQASLSQPQ